MELTSGVEKYLNHLVSDDSIYLVLIYGSSILANMTESSDLDVFVCGNLAMNYRKVMVIDNQELEINFVDVDCIEKKIEKSIEDNNSYYESVFNNNIVLKNSYSLLEECKKHLADKKRNIKKSNRDMPLRNKHLLCDFYYGFRKNLDLYNYFNFLDEVRMTLAYMYNYPV